MEPGITEPGDIGAALNGLFDQVGIPDGVAEFDQTLSVYTLGL
jgi:hypothetical protein